jgi:methanol--5-hydroxybenzimidazolylcobamide Co-methyltransferase
MIKYKKPMITDVDALIFGHAPKPVKCGHGLNIGNGTVFPEINFTLPVMKINNETWKEVLEQYEEIALAVISRATKLKLPGLVVEFEQLPPMTENPQWGAEITRLLSGHLSRFYESTGIPNALRVTVIDLRDADRPPLLREGKNWDLTKEAFISSAQAGADILSIESVGGKEVHDQALVYGDLTGMVVALGSLAWRDMGFLWKEINHICQKYNIIPGGDTACGFANTAMQLAGKGMIPSVLAAIDRAASVPRSLVAYEYGARGPSKDCAYEGPVLKAITGCPISMEGKSSSCAHFSPLGNIASASADLWSNESVQNVRLLSGSAPEAYLELLAYDCRLLNTAITAGGSVNLRNWLVESDVRMSVEALMLDPHVVLNLAQEIVKVEDGYRRTVSAVHVAFEAIDQAVSSARIELSDMELQWLKKIESDLNHLPDSEEEALAQIKQSYGSLYLASAYGLV